MSSKSPTDVTAMLKRLTYYQNKQKRIKMLQNNRFLFENFCIKNSITFEFQNNK